MLAYEKKERDMATCTYGHVMKRNDRCIRARRLCVDHNKRLLVDGILLRFFFCFARFWSYGTSLIWFALASRCSSSCSSFVTSTQQTCIWRSFVTSESSLIHCWHRSDTCCSFVLRCSRRVTWKEEEKEIKNVDMTKENFLQRYHLNRSHTHTCPTSIWWRCDDHNAVRILWQQYRGREAKWTMNVRSHKRKHTHTHTARSPFSMSMACAQDDVASAAAFSFVKWKK